MNPAGAAVAGEKTATIRADRMRLVFVTASRRWTGGERCMSLVAQGLAKRGHDVVLTYDPRGLVGARTEGVERVPVKVRNDGDAIAVARLARLMRRHRTAVVCTNTVRELRVAGVAARLARARVVRRFGGMDPLGGDRISRLYYRFLLDAVIRDCQWGLDQVRMHNPWFHGSVFRARNGVHTARLAGLEPAPVAALGGGGSGEVLIGSLGRVEAAKGAVDLALATARLGGRPGLGDSGVRLVYIGAVQSVIQRRIRNALADAAARVQVVFAGAKEPDEALRLLKACHIMAHATHADSFSFAVLEGMALGLPVVASRVGGLDEAVLEGETGFLVPTEDTGALSSALECLVGDGDLRRRMGCAGQRRAAERLDTRQMLNEYEAAFHHMIAGAPEAVG